MDQVVNINLHNYSVVFVDINFYMYLYRSPGDEWMFFLFRYVSTQYIHDCVKENEQLDIESYRLNLIKAPGSSPALNTKESCYGGMVYNLCMASTRKKKSSYTWIP